MPGHPPLGDGTFWGHTSPRTFGELLIDLEEDKAALPTVGRGVRTGGVRERATGGPDPFLKGE
jgi:hypothetical protein